MCVFVLRESDKGLYAHNSRLTQPALLCAQAVEEMTAEHLPGALILEYELFGEDNSLIADFALGIGR